MKKGAPAQVGNT